MRILVLGAGGIGGYYGARIDEAGGDVTFLVRSARAEQLKKNGLRVSSAFGDIDIAPKTVTTESLKDHFDVIIVASKAYDLGSAMDAIAPAVGAETAIVPLLNGVRHIDILRQRFGADRVLGGVALISVTMTPAGEIKHLNQAHRFVTGALTDAPPKWLSDLSTLLAKTKFDFMLSEAVEQVLWDKIVFLTTLAGATCTLRAGVGHILATLAGEGFIEGLLGECTRIAAACGHPVAETQLGAYRSQLFDKNSGLMASMLRDVEKGGPTEADHILGDMVRRADEKGVDVPLLKLAYSHLQAYDWRRKSAAA